MIKVEVLQDKARQLGVTSEDIAGALNGIVAASTSPRSATRSTSSTCSPGPTLRAPVGGQLLNLHLPGRSGQSVPLAAIATFSYEIEQPVVWRRSRIPTITLRAGILDDTQPATIVEQARPPRSPLSRRPYQSATLCRSPGPVEESAKAQGPIVAMVPPCFSRSQRS